MLGNLGFSEIVLVSAVGLLLFGPKKLPEIGRTAGKMVREFRRGVQGMTEVKKDES